MAKVEWMLSEKFSSKPFHGTCNQLECNGSFAEFELKLSSSWNVDPFFFLKNDFCFFSKLIGIFNQIISPSFVILWMDSVQNCQRVKKNGFLLDRKSHFSGSIQYAPYAHACEKCHFSCERHGKMCLAYCHAKASKWEKSLKIILYLCSSINHSVLTRTHKPSGSDNFRKCNLHLHFHKCQLFGIVVRLGDIASFHTWRWAFDMGKI